ncbi:zincin-like metallopeptidase domain-containing protein [Novosphingobium olei]|uniref:Antirestriction protein ArdC n=1 Tax=Novosphingobium olei TaxID=2728851 RepID=A0A7Y0BPY3_9SPHN|nr:zincin-like metallopeptidase domain-containing protein [Novosphingobium olei]NML94384.1 antirestriction protein ArdC [Novosphingobium olei]
MTCVRKIGGGSQIRAGLSGYVAELSSAMLGAELGLPVTHLDSHASYIEHWLKLLREDDRAILTAAAKAEEASSLLLKLGGRTIADVADEPEDVALAA